MRTVVVSLIVLINLHGSGHCQSIDFDTAWRRVMSYAPSIAAADAQVAILEGEAQQVSLWINPILEVESENIGINKPSDEVEPPQTTFSLIQTIELGGKRASRFNLASSLKCAAYWDAQIERANIQFALTLAFIEARAAYEKWELACQRHAISERIVEIVHKQIQNGKVSPIQEKKARLELMSESLLVREAFSQLERARTRLAAMWGSSCPDFDCVDFELYACIEPPCVSMALGCFFQTVDFSKAQQVLQSASQNLSLQKANRIPDVTLMGGYRIFHDSHVGSWVAGIQIPLPLFNRNQGNVRSADYEVVQAQFQLDEVVRNAHERILTTHERIETLYEQSALLCHKMLPEAQDTLKWTEAGYEKGKYEYLDLLEAQKMLFEIQEKCVEILCEYHLNRAELARLSGCRL